MISISPNVSYGHSDIITQAGNGIKMNDVKNSLSKPSFAADLGLIYEWRPDKDKYQYEMDCKKWYYNDRNKIQISSGLLSDRYRPHYALLSRVMYTTTMLTYKAGM